MTRGGADADTGLDAAAGKATKKYCRMKTMRGPATATSNALFYHLYTYVQTARTGTL